MAFLLLSFVACGDNASEQSNASDSASGTASDELPPESITKAQALIKEGKYAEAYAVLYPDRENEDVRAMLDNFKVVPTHTGLRSYSNYNRVEKTEYNEHGDVIRLTLSDPKYSYGDVTYSYEYVYDENGNVLKKSETDDEYGTVQVTEYEYDDQNRIVKIIEEDHTTENVYDDAGNVIKETKTVGGERVHVSEYTYDDHGNKLSYTETYNGELERTEEYSYEYNEHGDITKYIEITDLTNRTEREIRYEYTYDSEGRKTKIVSDGYVGAKTEEFEYDERGDVIKKTETTSRTVTVYDYGYVYDDGRLLEETAVIYSWSDSSLEEKYDEHGNLILRQNDDSLIKHEYTYDKNGFIIKDIETTDNQKNYGKIIVNTIEYTNDEKGRVIKSVSTDEDGRTYTKEFTYDSEDRKLKETRTEEYGEYSRTYYIDEYTYDELGNILTYYHKYYESEDTYNYTYVYDNNGNVLEKKRDGVTIIKYIYDANGNQIKTENYTDGSVGEWTEYTYDEKDRMVKAVKYDAGDAVVAVKEWLFDEEGNLIKETVDKGDSKDAFLLTFHEYVYEYTYDELGNTLTCFKSETDINGYETSFCEDTYSGYEYFYMG